MKKIKLNRKKKKKIVDYYKKKNEEDLKNFREKININCEKLWCPPINIEYENITESCFTFKIYQNNEESFDDIKFKQNKNNCKNAEITKCSKIDMVLDSEQKKIIQLWFMIYIKMYNETVNYIRKRISTNDLIIFKETNIKLGKCQKTLKLYLAELKNLGTEKDKIVYKIGTSWIKHRMDEFILYDIKNEIKLKKQSIYLLKKDITVLTKKMKKMKKINNLIDFRYVRKKMKKTRDRFIELSQHREIKYNTKMYVHNMDYAIKSACTSYKSCITNYLHGYQKKFRIKYMRNNKKRKVMDIESSFIINNQLCPKILGDIKYFYNKERYILTSKKNVKIYYDSELDIYQLLVPENVKIEKTESTKYIGLDQGIRAFVTGLSNDEVIKIGENMSKVIEKYLKEIDKINAKEMDEKKKSKKVRKYMNKIRWRVDEMHWKVIKYLTENYKTIMIGDYSIKDCIKKGSSVLSEMQKRIGNLLSPYKFRQRLQYKCAIKRLNFMIIDEKYTTQVCSMCGNRNEKLGGSKIYKCTKCKKEIERDVNSCRGIIIKA
jgi:putative transposase